MESRTKKKFPTLAEINRKNQEIQAVQDAGGIVHNTKVNKRNNEKKKANETHNTPETVTKKARIEDTVCNDQATQLNQLETEERTGDSIKEDVNEKKRCFQFGRGECLKGDECSFSHDFVPTHCPYFLKGQCERGFKCFNIHSIS